MKQIQEERNLWEYLKHTTRPIVVYGMGNGADKLLTVCQKKGISISGMYCSDEFVREKIFHGFVVGTRKQIEAQFQNFIVLVAFGSHVPGVMLQMEKTAQEYETYLPDLPLYGEELFDRGFLKAHEKELGQVAELWEDEESRQLYHEILLYKWSGKLQYLKRIQYREQGYKEIFGIGRKEVYVDVGAYRGDTVERFIRVAGGYQKIVAIEPDEKTFIKLQKYCRDKENIECICAAAYCKDTFLPFSAKTGRNSTLAAQGKQIAAKKIDTMLNGECATLIKYDVEGAEREALEGSLETLKTWRPNLLISLYHKNTDLFEIPLWLNAQKLGYRFYLRREPCYPAWDIMLLAKRSEMVEKKTV